MAAQEDSELTASHGLTKSTATCGAVPAEKQLKTNWTEMMLFRRDESLVKEFYLQWLKTCLHLGQLKIQKIMHSFDGSFQKIHIFQIISANIQKEYHKIHKTECEIQRKILGTNKIEQFFFPIAPQLTLESCGFKIQL